MPGLSPALRQRSPAPRGALSRLCCGQSPIRLRTRRHFDDFARESVRLQPVTPQIALSHVQVICRNWSRLRFGGRVRTLAMSMRSKDCDLQFRSGTRTSFSTLRSRTTMPVLALFENYTSVATEESCDRSRARLGSSTAQIWKSAQSWNHRIDSPVETAIFASRTRSLRIQIHRCSRRNKANLCRDTGLLPATSDLRFRRPNGNSQSFEVSALTLSTLYMFCDTLLANSSSLVQRRNEIVPPPERGRANPECCSPALSETCVGGLGGGRC